jgi:hypothetical protein
MKIINKKICNQIKAEEGYVISWDGAYARTINIPFSRDIQSIYAECSEITEAEYEAIKEAEEIAAQEASVEELLAALEVLGVSE